ncbi:hypothetical protein BXZ70DRAFT_442992 [Cristinia sonorae]|uniref:F-box domain-containing protein n=1 Tax=Cristinia sonorae TaxID=1940300 RepID=A0A8K0UI95_9AGAR|nr:hypothetical protein BXZ70DRAFT_442992 [Cristinia sonorae]
MIATNPDLLVPDLGRLSLKNPNGFASLPLRVVLAILDQLSYQDLLRFKLTCRYLSRVIGGFPSLQYKIELAAAGMTDVPQNDLSPVKKLAALRKYQRKWSQLNWDSFDHYYTNVYGADTWDFSYGLLSYDVEEDHDEISCILPGSVVRGVPEERWTLYFAQKFAEYFVEPSQDLVLPVFNDEDDIESHVMLYSLYSGGQHSKAKHDRIILPGPTGSVDELRVHENKLGCLTQWEISDWTGCIFTLWDWQTGEAILSYDSVIHAEAYPEANDIIRRDFTNFTFLDATHVALSACLTNRDQVLFQGLIQIIDLTKGPDAFSSSVNLYLPEIADNACIAMLGLTRNTTTPGMSERKHYPAFRTADDQAVVSVMLELKHQTCENHQMVPFFFNTGKLLAIYEAATQDTNGSSPVNLSWDEWGPDSARVLCGLPHFDHKMTVYGSRFVWCDDGFLTVADFNTLGALSNEFFPDGKVSDVTGAVVLEETTFKHKLLKKPVVTRMPYRYVCSGMKVPKDTSVVCLGEDTILIQDADKTVHALLTM